MTKDIDVVVFGATGFTGRQAAERMKQSATAGLNWAIAGRNKKKLDALHRDLELDESVEVLVADSADAGSVGKMTERARVLLTTAGPFARYGTSVFEACVEHRTHYADITGETVWVRHMIDRHHERARAEGTVLVPMSGYDSIPSDIGAYHLVERLRTEHDQGTRRVHGSFRSRGGLNGGTLATALLSLTEMGKDDRRLAAHPYTLSPDVDKPRAALFEESDPRRPFLAPNGSWEAPHFMGPINTRVVRRSASLFAGAGRPYGEDFRYTEGMGVKGGGRVAATLTTAALGGVEVALSSRFARPLATRALPKPGEGPSEESMDHGRTRARLWAEGEQGVRLEAVLDYAGDPGNRFTVLSLIEVGLLLAGQEAELGLGRAGKAGVLTPAFAFGSHLVERLRANGVRLDGQE
jgi:short subunit dehydrogenase-like uncharacterized protein